MLHAEIIYLSVLVILTGVPCFFSITEHKGQNSTKTRCCGFLVLESLCRGQELFHSITFLQMHYAQV